MKRLIVAGSDAGAGCLKAARIADKVTCLHYWLVHGPAPLTLAPEHFFSARAGLLGPAPGTWEQEDDCATTAQAWQDIAAGSGQFDRVELWVDPDCNAQLKLIQFLDWVRSYPGIVAKLALVHLDLRLAEQAPAHIASLNPSFQHVGDTELNTATRVWHAYRQPTPEAWFALLGEPLAALPRLSEAVLRMLEELPASDTGIGATQLNLLAIVAGGEQRPMHVLGQHIAGERPPVYSYWHLGCMLDHLARCCEPLILGLADGPFDLALHDDEARFKRYRASTLTLSDLGKAVLAGRDDFSRHNPVDRWWGGTRLTNDRLWRWDGHNKALVAPS